MTQFWRKRWFLAAVIIAVLVVASLSLVWMKVDYDQGQDAVLQYFSKEPGMPEAFAKLENLTTPGSAVLCWWDYGRAVKEWSHREVIEAYPSRDIYYTMGSTRSFLGNLQSQLFATWGSSEKIHDLANIFTRSEAEAMPLLRKYNAQYAIIFIPDELQKFPWIAQIAGVNASDYLTYHKESDTYEPTARGGEATLLRLIFDNTLPPQHFTKLFDSGRAKIYRINYP